MQLEWKVIIADDDNSSRTLLTHFIELVPEFIVTGHAENGEQLVQLVMEQKPDIIFVDIKMPGLNGVEAVKVCKHMLPMLQVIFTTGYEEYAVEAFTLNAVDYLVKPIERARVFMALEKAKLAVELTETMLEKPTYKPWSRLAVKSGNSSLYIVVDEILFIEKKEKKSMIHTETDLLETLEPLQSIEKRLPGYFYKTHRSYLVNLHQITKIDSFGETYMAHFAQTDQKAYISKLKINKVYELLGT